MLGPGLVGGSLLHSLRRRVPGIHLRAWARREESVHQIRSVPGLVDFVSNDLQESVDGADLVILAMPTGAMAPTVAKLQKFSADSNVLFTDVGSVKGSVMNEVAPLVEKIGAKFIGSHPMAGSEKVGFEHAHPDLFVAASVILTESGKDPVELEKVERFWESVGAVTTLMSAADHDDLVAGISHLPHLVAAALVRSVLQDNASAAGFCGGGFRDTTRVSSGPEDMWAGILADNAPAVERQLAGLIGELETWRSALHDLDRATLRSFLSQARRLRDQL